MCWVGISCSSSFPHLGSWALGFAFIAYHAYGWSHWSAPVGPLMPWVCTGCRWEAVKSKSMVKLPTFTCCIQRRQPPFRPAGLEECSEQALPLWNSFPFLHPPGARVPVQRDASMSEHVPKVVRSSLLGNSFQVSLRTSWLAALATTAGPSFRYVNVLTLTFRSLQVLTPFIFRHLRFQKTSGEIAASSFFGRDCALGGCP